MLLLLPLFFVCDPNFLWGEHITSSMGVWFRGAVVAFLVPSVFAIGFHS